MKRQLSLVLALVMILGSFSSVFAAASVDQSAVNVAGAFLKTAGVLEGADGNLMLTDNLKRRDAVVLLSRLYGEEDLAQNFPSEDLTFKDLTDDYYNGFIAWSVSKEIMEGHYPETFGPNEEMTAQDFATVVLRVLGHTVDEAAYPKALELAEELGLLVDMEGVENKTVVTRGMMALMTLNAMYVEVKGTGKTLAETLNITNLPEREEEKPEKLEAKVKSENLREVLVELNEASLVDAERLTNVDKYRVVNNEVERVKLDGNNVIVNLKNPMTEGRSYELIIRDLNRDIDGKHKFTATDNVAPEVLEVTSLGKNGIRVTTSEPIKNARERNFLIDGKNLSMIVEDYGRELVLIPYHAQSFPEDAKELTIKALEDYAGFKSSEQKFDLELDTKDEAPVVKDIIVKGQEVLVKFDKDVFSKTVKKYESKRQPGNISYEEGRQVITATGAEKIDVDTVKYNFEGKLPRRADLVDFTVERVENHSGVAMEKTTMKGRVILDHSEPVILDSFVVGASKVYNSDNTKVNASVRVYFDKDITGSFAGISKTDFVAKDHVKLFETEVLGRNDVSGKIKAVKYWGARRDVIVVDLEDLVVNTKKNNYEFEYILEIENFTDTTVAANRMYRDYVDFEVLEPGVAFSVKNEKIAVYNYLDANGREMVIHFNKPVDKTIAENPENYIFIYDDNSKDDLKELGGKAIAEANGFTVTLQIPSFNEKDVVLEILPTLKDVEGVRISGARFYNFNTATWENHDAVMTQGDAITYENNSKEAKGTLLLDLGVTTANANDVDVKLTGVVGAKAQAKVIDKNGTIVVMDNLEVTTGNTDDTVSLTVPVTARGTYTLEVTQDGKVVSTLEVKVVDNVNTGKVKYTAGGTEVVLANNGTLALPQGTNLTNLRLDDFIVTADSANAKEVTKELVGNNTKLVVTITAENGKAEVYTMTLEFQVVLTIKTAPTKVAYTTADATLDLTGLVVTLANADGTTEDIAFADFATKGLTASPANGSTVAASGDVTITHTASGATAKQAITFN